MDGNLKKLASFFKFGDGVRIAHCAINLFHVFSVGFQECHTRDLKC